MMTMRNSTNSEGVPPLHHIFHGEVANVQTYGAFVKIPGCKKQGLVHKSQMSSVRVDDPAEMLAKGEMVYCKIIGMEGEGEKISLSMKVVNQTTGRDLDPNNVQLSQDEKKRREWKHIGRDKIELGAELNTTCRKCGGHGHLAMDCFMAKADKVYELIPDLDTLTQLPSPDGIASSKAHKKKKKKKDKKSKGSKKSSSRRRTRSRSRDESDEDISDNDRRNTMNSRDQFQVKEGDRQRKHNFSKDEHHYRSPSRKRERKGQMESKQSRSDSRDIEKRRKNYACVDRKSRENDDNKRDEWREQKKIKKRERSRSSSSSSDSKSNRDTGNMSRGGMRRDSSSGSDAAHGTNKHTEQERSKRKKLRRSESEDSVEERSLNKKEKRKHQDEGKRNRQHWDW